MDRETLAASLSDYLHERRMAGLSRQTLMGYRSCARAFANWIGTRPLDQDAARGYRDHLAERTAPATVRLHFALLRGWGDLCVERGLLPENYFLAVTMPRLKVPARELFHKEDVPRLLAAAERMTPPRGDRWAVIAALGFGCGLRRGEMTDLVYSDVDFAACELRVRHGKGGKTRYVPLSPELHPPFREWLALRPPHSLPQLLAWGQRPFGREGIANHFREALRAAGCDRPGLTPHAMRHYAVTRWAEVGNLEDARLLAGHSNLDTTQRYTHSSRSRLRDVAGRATRSTFALADQPAPPLHPSGNGHLDTSGLAPEDLDLLRRFADLLRSRRQPA